MKQAIQVSLIFVMASTSIGTAWAEAKLEEVIVTAQRREQSLSDVPIAVTALDAGAIAERGLTDFSTYLSSVPGASFNDIGSLANEVKFRGIGNGNSYLSPTTAIYLGDVPIVHTGRNVVSSYNFELVDMERVEVLRGPQGQLYGSNSLGGAIRNLPAKADLERFAVRSKVSGFTTEGGGDSYHIDATLNAPIVANTAAARLTAYHTTEGGWYDNVFPGGVPLSTLAAFAPPIPGAPGAFLPAVLAMSPPAASAYVAPANPREDVNELRRDGARGVLSWESSDALRGDLILAWERTEVGGEQGAQAIPNVPGFIPGTVIVPNTVNPFFSIPYPAPSDYTRMQQSMLTTGSSEDEIKLVNLVLSYDFGGATLTSSTAWWSREAIYGSDVSTVGFPTTGIAQAIPIYVRRVDKPEKLIQELRLQSNGQGPWQWLAGLYYETLDEDFVLRTTDESGFNILRTEASLFVPPGTPLPYDIAYQSGVFEDTQLAAFGELEYALTPEFSIAASFRWFTIDQSSDIENNGFQFTGQGRSTREHSDNVFTPKLNLSWRPSDDQLYYFTAAEGFRTGVVNPELPLSVCGRELAAAGYPDGLPATDPDTTRNYELGAKLAFAEQRVTLNAAVYYIDWIDMQAQALLPSLVQGPSRCQSPAILNVGDAHSQGVELELAAALSEQWRLDASFAYTDAEYDDTYPAAGVARGQTIENVPETMGFLGLHYGFEAFGRTGFARAEWNYVGDKEKKGADFVSQAQPVELGDYSTVALRAGLDLTSSAALEVWADNLLDEDGVAYAADSGGFVPPTVYFIRPRSIGLSLRLNF